MSAHFYKDGVLVHPSTPGALPSPTTILEVATNKDLKRWREKMIGEEGEQYVWDYMSDASEKGTRVHECCEDLLEGRDTACMEEDLPYVLGFVAWQDTVDISWFRTELYVESSRHGYGGRLDLLAIIDDQAWVIDFKTSKQHSDRHGLQLASYRQAVREQTGLKAKTAVLKLTNKTKKGWQWKVYNEPLAPLLGLKKFFDWEFKKNPPKPVWDGGVIRRSDG